MSASERAALEAMLTRTEVEYDVVHRVRFDKGYTPGGKTVDTNEVYTVLTINPDSRDAFAFIFNDYDWLVTAEPCGY